MWLPYWTIQMSNISEITEGAFLFVYLLVSFCFCYLSWVLFDCVFSFPFFGLQGLGPQQGVGPAALGLERQFQDAGPPENSLPQGILIGLSSARSPSRHQDPAPPNCLQAPVLNASGQTMSKTETQPHLPADRLSKVVLSSQTPQNTPPDVALSIRRGSWTELFYKILLKIFGKANKALYSLVPPPSYSPLWPLLQTSHYMAPNSSLMLISLGCLPCPSHPHYLVNYYSSFKTQGKCHLLPAAFHDLLYPTPQLDG